MKYIIGRDPQNSQIQIKNEFGEKISNAPVYAPQDVSREHVLVTVVDNATLHIHNIKAANITYVNGQEVLDKVVKSTDVVQLGRSRFQVDLFSMLGLQVTPPQQIPQGSTYEYEATQLQNPYAAAATPKAPETKRMQQTSRPYYIPPKKNTGSGILKGLGIVFIIGVVLVIGAAAIIGSINNEQKHSSGYVADNSEDLYESDSRIGIEIASNPFIGKTYKGTGNGGGLYTEMAITFLANNKCTGVSDWYQAYPSKKSVDGTYSYDGGNLIVKFNVDGEQTVLEFDVKNNGTIIEFDKSDPEMDGTMGMDIMSLKLQN